MRVGGRLMKYSLTILCAAFIAGTAYTVALADPVWVQQIHNPAQDDWTLPEEVEELSTAAHKGEQLIASQDVPWGGHIPCPVDYRNETMGTTRQVWIQNLTSRSFYAIYYVGDVHDIGLETTFTNVDEDVADVSPWHTNNDPGLAFKIDAVGNNTPLVYEDNPNGIFEPGEVWEFVIQEYSNTLGLPPSALGSVGPAPWGAIAQASMQDTISSGSIITPEPATIALLGIGSLVVLRRKRR
jgi:hypothetical protein